MRKISTLLMLFCAFVGTAFAQTSLRISDGLLATQVPESTQYTWTSGTLTAPTEGEFNKLRITFLKNSTGRKPAGFEFVCIAEFYLYDKEGNQVALTVDNFSSNATQSNEGSMEAICDGVTSGESDKYDWYWHSQWSGDPIPYGCHYLEINLTDIDADLSEYKIGWVTRQHDGSPKDVIISAGATTEEAAYNANSLMLPEVSTEIAKIYTIKSVRTKNYLRYSEENAKPVQNSALANESYWYFTQGTDGKVVVRNVASGKVLGNNYEMSTEGEWYISPAVYRPGLVFSKTTTITNSNCMDDQSGTVGDWKHVEGDNEGTTWLAEEVVNAPVDVPVFSLNGKKIASIGEAVTEVVADKWYILNNVGRSNYVSQEGNSWKMRATNGVAANDIAKEKAGYLFKITKNGEYYNIVSGNGKYFQLGSNSASTSASPVNFEIGKVASSDNNFYLLDKENNYVADGQATDNNFVGWSTSAPANAGGNDSYRLLPVEFLDADEVDILKTQLGVAIAEAQTLYNGVKDHIGEGVGKYSAPADIETQFAAIVAFHAAIDGNTTIAAINEKMAELEALIAAVQLNMPVAGKFYRINNNGNYITSNVADSRIALSTTANDAASVYYYDGTHLVAYATGLYFGLNSSDWTFETVGSNDISAIQFVAAANGAIAKYNVKSADRWLHSSDTFVNRCTNNTCGNAHNWTIEEVTWLPIPVNAEVGYTTIYSPVELALSQGRFKAYTASTINGNSVMLEEQTVVPANVGVVLELQEGAEVENGCAYLQIKATETEVTSLLQGTFADTYINEVSYVLANGTNGVGLYKAAINVSTDTANDEPEVTYEAWLNNGFKAYLPATAGSANVLRFNFGGNTTAIESVVNGLDLNAPIYDLSGRRVVNAVKGGLYIQNGKKFIVQ